MKTLAVAAYDQTIIDNAVAWACFQFCGRDDRRTVKDLPSRAAAEAKAREMLVDNSQRPVAIYAIDAAGRQAHVVNLIH